MESIGDEDLLPENVAIWKQPEIKMEVEGLNLECGGPVTKPGQLLHHSLPITCLRLLDGVILVASEGPSLLLKMAYLENQSFKRFQLFPSQFVISGMEFVAVTGERDKNEALISDFSYVGYVWAGSLGKLVYISRSKQGHLRISNEEDNLVNFDFIPVAAKWLAKGTVLACLSVLNSLVLFELAGNGHVLQEMKRIKCDKSETLFSGGISVDEQRDRIRVFAGTVFNGVIVWDVVEDLCVIKHELKCHDGIIFSVEYNPDKRTLLSTSDDRTVAVWQFGGSEGDDEDAKLVHRFYGHDARVWKALLVRGYVLSVGESSEVRVNILKDGREHKTWRAHDGAPIFTCVYDNDLDILYTGGNDGSIRKWPMWWYQVKPRVLGYDVVSTKGIDDMQGLTRGSGRWSENKDFPKTVALLDINHVLVSMESGRILGLTWEGDQFDLLQDERCEGYQIIKMSPDQNILAVAGNDGHFYTAEISLTENEACKKKILHAEKLFMTRISWNIISMIWLDCSRLLIVCLNKGIVLLLSTNEKGKRSEVEFVQTFNLNLQRPGVTAAVEIQKQYVVLGDELGALHVFRYHKSNDAIAKFETAHKDGCTNLLYFKSQLWSTGRDGKLRCFRFETNSENDLQVEISALYTIALPFDWVTGVFVNMKEMLSCGFQKEDFVVYSINEKRSLLKIPCGGGGNRKWDFKYGHGLNGSPNASLAFVKDKEIFYTFLPMDGYLGNALKDGLHSKTINCGVHLESANDQIEYITGSEDGSLKWFQWDRTNDRSKSIETKENHVSSIRSASVITTKANNKLLFTGGGRSQLCIYKIDLESRRLELLKEIILVKTTFKQTEGDVRIMDIALIERNEEIWCFNGCSDGIIRLIYFNVKTNKFKIAGLLNGNTHAVMRIGIIKATPSEVSLCGVTSNGYFLLWSWTGCESEERTNSPPIPEKNPDFQKLLRRTAFLSMSVCQISEDSRDVSVICGGDDCSINYFKLTMDNCEFSIENEWTQDQTQRGAVVGVEICGDTIYTLSNDEIIGVWDLTGNLIRKQYAGVSDCQGFVVNRTANCITCFGKGLSWLPINL